MTRYCLCVGTAFFLVVAALPAADDDEGDKAKFQATWKLTEIEQEGKAHKVTNQSTEFFELKFAGDNVTASFTKEGTTEKGTYKIDPSKKIKTIDFMPTTNDDKGKTLLGIYELKGDMLTICVAEPEIKKRPTEFKSKADGIIVYVLQRVKS